MAVLVLAMLMLSMTGHARCTWCVCKEMSDTALQKTLDYACGAGADCNPVHSNGPCYQPNSVRAHCSYAVNSFFQKKGQAPGTCDFAGTAAISTSDPSYSGCSFPATVSAAGSTTTTPSTNTPSTNTPSTNTPSNTTPSTTTPTTTTPTTTTPYSTTPSNGVLGGIGTGMGPSGVNTDIDGGFRLQATSLFSCIITLMGSSLMLLWG